MLKLFHLSVVLLNGFTLWYDQIHIEVPIPEQFRQHTQHLPFKCRFLFLTIWTLVLQTLYFSLALCNDIFGSNAPQPKTAPLIRHIKDTLFGLAFPAAIFVTTMFWTLFYINRKLIMPDFLEGVLPEWVNQVMHSTISVFALIEVFSSNINYPSWKVGLPVGLTFALSYIAMLTFAYLKAGTMLYPVLDTSNPTTGFGILFSMAVYGISVYFGCAKFHSLVSSGTKKDTGKRKRRIE